VILKLVDKIIGIDWTHLSIFWLLSNMDYATEGGLDWSDAVSGDGPFSVNQQ
jgi:hypothetical protein